MDRNDTLKKYKRGTVFLYKHAFIESNPDYWIKTPFLVFGQAEFNPGAVGTFYINRGRVLKRAFPEKDLENAEILCDIELTDYILSILEERGKHATRLLDAIFNYARGETESIEVS